MSSPIFEFHKAIRSALTTSVAVTSMIAARIYKPAPQNVIFPYVLIGDADASDAGYECGEDAAELALDLHVYSRAGGDEEAKRIVAAIHTVFHMPDSFPSMAVGWEFMSLSVSAIRCFQDPDGRTTHGVVTVEALIHPT